MTLGVFVGRFQPFHKQHLEAILKLYEVSDKVLIFVTYYSKRGAEMLSVDNPIPVQHRISYIKSILKDYFDEEEYLILPLDVSNFNFIFKILDAIRKYENRKVIFSTRDIKRLLEYKLFSILLGLLHYDVEIIYDNNRVIFSGKLREEIGKGKYQDVRKYLVKDLDRKLIEHIKYFSNKRTKNHILKYLI